MNRTISSYLMIAGICLTSISVEFANPAAMVQEPELRTRRERPRDNIYRSPSDRHKIQVSDPGLTAEIEAVGGRLIGDYGSYKVFQVDTAAGQELSKDSRIEFRDDLNLILLNTGAIDTTSNDAISLRKSVESFSGRRLHLVQFAAPIQPQWYQALINTGVEVVTYIPNNTYLVYGEQPSLTRLQRLSESTSYVQWDGAYEDKYKIDPAAQMVNAKGQAVQQPSDIFAIQLTHDPATNASTLVLVNNLKLERIFSDYTVLNYRNAIVRMNPAEVPALAMRPDVISIQRYIVPNRRDERQNQIVAGNLTGNLPTPGNYLTWLAGKGLTQAQFTASAFAVDVTDSGIDNGTTSPNHFGLWANGIFGSTSRVIYARLEGTPNPPGTTLAGCDGHGTINAHIVGGYSDLTTATHADASGFRYGLGVAPFVRVGSSVIFDPYYTFPNFPSLQSKAHNNGARISSNSWGADIAGQYNVDSQAFDALTRDARPPGSELPLDGNQEMVMVFATGNAGPGDQTVGAPATAKNVISVGAAESVRTLGAADGCAVSDSSADSANDMTAFSSRGPTADGRAKPDIVAPGTHVTGGVAQAYNPGVNGTALACFDASGVCGGPASNFFPLGGQQFYTASSGTSHSCPAVAGGAALLRQYFINNSLAAPSPAMTKAYLMNSARYMTGVAANDMLWSTRQGMGEMNLGFAFDSTPRILRDQRPVEMFTATGQTFTSTGNISDMTKPFRVTVAWTDAPGSTTGNTYKNDLDLTVTAGGNTYKGNVFTGGNSTTGGSADRRNNVESVFIPAGVSGSFSVVVTAANINSDGVPNVGGPLDQDFALVVYNAISVPMPVVKGAGSLLVVESCGASNGAIDPGEIVTADLSLQNIGTGSTTNLVATLQATGGVTLPGGPQAYGVLAAGGSTVTKSFSFTAIGVCAGTLTATLSLQDGATNLGTVSFTFTLGATNTASAFSYTGPPVAIPNGDTIGVDIPFVVSGYPENISDLNFRFDGTSCSTAAGSTTAGLDHSWVGDLVIKLISPMGTTVTLIDRPGAGSFGSSGNNFCQTLLDDQGGGPAIDSITGAGNPYTGTYAPQNPLSMFNGENPNGTWKLNVSDRIAADSGNVRAFSLLISTYKCCQPVTLSVSPTTVAAGGILTATWTNIPNPTATDWLALYASSGAPNSPPVAWRYTNGLASSNLPFNIPADAAPGSTYELRLWSNNIYTRLATSNSFTIQVATLSVSPATVNAGGTVTATWANIPDPTATDWLALYASSGAPNSPPIAWRYTNGLGSSNLPFNIPANVAPGATYELRLWSNNGYTRLATSNSFTIQVATLTVSPTTVNAGGTVTATWANISSPTAKDWLALYASSGAANSPPVAWRYTNGLAGSNLPFIIPANAAPGTTYELRLWSNNGYTRLATSNSFTIQVTTLTVNPTTVNAGETVTATWANIPSPTATDWLALYNSAGAPNSPPIAWRYSNGLANGNLPFDIPVSAAPGATYELRLWGNNGYTRLATSNPFIVQGGSPITLEDR